MIQALPSAAPELSDGVVRLRALRESDTPWVTAACADPEIVRWTPIAQGTGEAQVARWIAGQADRLAAGTGVDWAVVRAADGTPLGHAGLHRIDRGLEQGELTYWITAPARGGGVATRAVLCIARFAFGRLGLSRLELLTMVGNAASQGVATKAGFTHEGVRRSAAAFKGVRHDLVVFSLLPADLPAQRPPAE